MGKKFFGILLFLFVLDFSVPYATAQQSDQEFVGAWTWFNPGGTTVNINSDGTTIHFEKGRDIDRGKWIEVAEGVIRISWMSGYLVGPKKRH